MNKLITVKYLQGMGTKAITVSDNDGVLEIAIMNSNLGHDVSATVELSSKEEEQILQVLLKRSQSK